MDWVVALSDAKSQPYALSEVGGKARNLGIMLAAGLPVPPAWCVTTAAYRRTTGTPLAPVLAELAAVQAAGRMQDAGTENLQRLAAHARSVVVDAPIPPHVTEAIIAAYRALGSGPVAVRSSATAEDLAEASFAGQHDTFLQVIGEEAVIDAVRACWASLWSDRVVVYRAGHGIDPVGVALAVVLQQMVDAQTAGVMFTADPVAGTRGRCVIDAGAGLGDSVVSGAVDPDHFVVDLRSGVVLGRRIGARATEIAHRPGGGVTTIRHRPPVPATDGARGRAASDGAASADAAEDGVTIDAEQDDLSLSDLPLKEMALNEAVLNEAALADLAALGRRVEELYGAPQDTEWAIDHDGRVWLTQARPITTLFPLLHRSDRTGTRVFFCVSLAQGLTRPITPLGIAAFRLIGSSLATVVGLPPADAETGPAALQVAAGRLFIDITAALGHPVGRRLILAALRVMEARSAAVLVGLVRDGIVPPVAGHALTLARPLGRLIVATGLPVRFAAGLVAPGHARRSIRAIQRRIRRDLALPAAATPGRQLELVTHHLGNRTFLAMPTTAPYAGAGFAALGLARALLRGIVQPGELQQILRGLPYNPTTEMDLNLWKLAQAVGADPDARRAVLELTDAELGTRLREGRLPPILGGGFARFLAAYGHRAVAEIDLGVPRWSEDPTQLFGVLRTYLRDGTGTAGSGASPVIDAAEQFRAGAAEAEAIRSDLVRRCRESGRTGPLRAALVDVALGRTRALAGLRESPKFLLVLTLALLRQHVLLVGDQLVEEKRLDQRDDVAFLDFADLRRGLAGESLQATVADRRSRYEQELRRRQIPRIVLSDGTEPEVAGNRDLPPGALVGSPASKGVLTARARVVLDPCGAHLEPGEVLVTPSTDPGWTPLFLTAGALVMEMGGANSHGAVVAREYGIPAVVGVPDATSRIHTGQLVTVDGAAGSVEILTDGSTDGDRAAAGR